MHNYYYCHYQITGILMSEYQVHAETANIGLGTPVQLNAMYEEAAHNRKRETRLVVKPRFVYPGFESPISPFSAHIPSASFNRTAATQEDGRMAGPRCCFLEPMEAESQHLGRQIGPV